MKNAVISTVTGTLVYEIKDEHGNILGEICFNPTDGGLADRADKAMKSLKAIVADLENAEDQLEAFREADKKIREAIDFIFMCDVSGVLFSKVSALAMTTGGKYVFENFLEAVQPIIEKVSKQAQAESQKRLEKYNKKYV